jgi:hypothetical protein
MRLLSLQILITSLAIRTAILRQFFSVDLVHCWSSLRRNSNITSITSTPIDRSSLLIDVTVEFILVTLKIMTNLEKQIQLLIQNAPKDGITPKLVATIAPVLRVAAKNLRHPRYYILQNSEGSWVSTTLCNKANPELEKQVIYAFPRLNDAIRSSHIEIKPQVVAKPIPIIDILFQLLAITPVDSIVFMETPGTNTNAVEVRRADLENMIQQTLQQHLPPPTNIA